MGNSNTIPDFENQETIPVITTMVFNQLSELDNYGIFSENNDECNILLNPIELRIIPDVYIYQDIRIEYFNSKWTNRWVRVKFHIINTNQNLTEQEINEINVGILLANNNIKFPPWYDISTCDKTLLNELGY
jgi:hypothetical protein